MISSSILTLLKINYNLSYRDLFGPFLLNNLVRAIKGFGLKYIYVLFEFKHAHFLLFLTEAIC